MIAIENFDRGVLFWWIVEGRRFSDKAGTALQPLYGAGDFDESGLCAGGSRRTRLSDRTGRGPFLTLQGF